MWWICGCELLVQDKTGNIAPIFHNVINLLTVRYFWLLILQSEILLSGKFRAVVCAVLGTELCQRCRLLPFMASCF